MLHSRAPRARPSFERGGCFFPHPRLAEMVLAVAGNAFTDSIESEAHDERIARWGLAEIVLAPTVRYATSGEG